jgi:hypothetical protein
MVETPKIAVIGIAISARIYVAWLAMRSAISLGRSDCAGQEPRRLND